MPTLSYVLRKFKLDPKGKSPIEIPNVSRDILGELFRELGFKVGAEIGVQAGEFSEVLCKAIPDLKLFCVDPYLAYEGYRRYAPQKMVTNFREQAHRRLKPYNCEFVEAFSMEAVKVIPDNSLDFVFIDSNHEFLHVTEDIVHWSKKVRRGGIVSGHDFIKRRHPTKHHVAQVVQGYTDAYAVKPWFLLGRQAKVEGEIRDRHRSWFWVNK